MTKNENGFSGVEVLLLLLIAGIIGYFSWYILHVQKKTTVATQTQISVEPAIVPKQLFDGNSIVKTFTFRDTTVSYRLPNGWVSLDYPPSGEAPNNQFFTRITDPDKQLQLDISVENGGEVVNEIKYPKYEKKFLGVHGNDYFMLGIVGHTTKPNAFESVRISACKDKECATKIKSDYWLSMAVHGYEFSDGLDVNPASPPIPVIQSVVASINYM